MTDIVAWVSAHWVEITVTFTAFVYFFEKVAALTTTTKDDGIAAFFVKILNWLAMQKKA